MSTPDFTFDDAEIAKLLKERDDWRRSATTAWREITSLKRRITFMRRGLGGLAGPNCLSEVDEYQRGAAADLRLDNAIRRRFEKAEKRRGRP